MYCKNCGSQLNENANYCNNCGNQVGAMNDQTIFETALNEEIKQSNLGYIGYSNRINDPALSKYIKNSQKYASIFGIVIALLAVIGFYIAGEISDDLENPEAVFYGFIIGGMFLLITFFTVIGKNKGKTWDGVVVNKTIEKKRRRVNTDNDDSYMQNFIVYTVFIKENNGRMHEIRIEDNDSRYQYYQIGDFVRHHKGLNSYEKYDKSRDLIVYCNACATVNSIQEDYCHRCKCPLLK